MEAGVSYAPLALLQRDETQVSAGAESARSSLLLL